jgi:hypothetical protein
MSDRPDDLSRGAAGPAVPDELAAVEAALAGALEHRAGGPLAEAAAAPLTLADEERFAEVEASVATAGSPRRLRLLGVAAAAVVVLVLGSLALFRADDGAEVHSVGGPSTSVAPEPEVPGTDPTAVTVPGAPEDAPITTVATGDLAGLDPANFTFPASVCSSVLDSEAVRMAPEPFTLVDGTATVPQLLFDGRTVPDGIHISLDEVVLGDVTADGQEDAVLTLYCAYNQSDVISPSIVVISAIDGVPTVIGGVTHSGFEVTRTVEVNNPGETITVNQDELVESVSAADGNLVIRWNQTAPLDPFSEQRHTTVTYGWDGQTFVPLAESDVVVIPAKEYVPPVFTPVESFDFASMLLPLDARSRGVGIERVACGFAFRDVRPVDAQLVDGAAVVFDEDDDELGTVAIEGVEHANVDDDTDLEGLVRFRCTRGSVSSITLTVFEAVVGPPDLLWSTTDYAGITGPDDVISVEAAVPGQCPLILTYQASGDPGSAALRVPYRREPLAYVQDPARCQ